MSNYPLRRPKNGEFITVEKHKKSIYSDTPVIHQGITGRVLLSDEKGFCLKTDEGKIIVFCSENERNGCVVLIYKHKSINYKAFAY